MEICSLFMILVRSNVFYSLNHKNSSKIMNFAHKSTKHSKVKKCTISPEFRKGFRLSKLLRISAVLLRPLRINFDHFKHGFEYGAIGAESNSGIPLSFCEFSISTGISDLQRQLRGWAIELATFGRQCWSPLGAWVPGEAQNWSICKNRTGIHTSHRRIGQKPPFTGVPGRWAPFSQFSANFISYWLHSIHLNTIFRVWLKLQSRQCGAGRASLL